MDKKACTSRKIRIRMIKLKMECVYCSKTDIKFHYNQFCGSRVCHAYKPALRWDAAMFKYHTPF
jgi:hypothetical protein